MHRQFSLLNLRSAIERCVVLDRRLPNTGNSHVSQLNHRLTEIESIQVLGRDRVNSR
ncbi:MAG: hypothetical protein WBC69_22565 [Geitlerinemataceae cyanobacterium]